MKSEKHLLVVSERDTAVLVVSIGDLGDQCILIGERLAIRGLRLQGFKADSRDIRALVVIAALGAALLVHVDETLELQGRGGNRRLRFFARRKGQ